MYITEKERVQEIKVALLSRADGSKYRGSTYIQREKKEIYIWLNLINGYKNPNHVRTHTRARLSSPQQLLLLLYKTGHYIIIITLRAQ